MPARCVPASLPIETCSVSAHLSNIFATVLPILLSLLIGYLTGKRLPKPVVTPLVGAITPVVWVILFIIGMESGAAFSTLASGMQVLKQSAIYAFTLSAVVFVCLLPLNRSGTAQTERLGGWRGLWHPLQRRPVVAGGRGREARRCWRASCSFCLAGQ